jgi:hypothetical protein
VLSYAEKNAGRWWLGQQQAALGALSESKPPDTSPIPFVRHIRHLCAGNARRSVSFDYAEVYTLNPRIGVCYCGVIKEVPDEMLGTFPHEDCAGGAILEAGWLAFIYREGRCADCGHTARSTTGRVVDARERQPAGKVTRAR